MISSQGYEIVPEWQDRRENGETCVEIAADVGECRGYISRRTKPPAKSIKRGENSGHENSFDKHNYNDNKFMKPTAAACIPTANFLLGKAGGFHWVEA